MLGDETAGVAGAGEPPLDELTDVGPATETCDVVIKQSVSELDNLVPTDVVLPAALTLLSCDCKLNADGDGAKRPFITSLN